MESPRTSWCAYTCENGYRINDVPAALNKNPLWGDDIYIFCRNGSWITNMEDHGHHIDEICLPEGLWFTRVHFFDSLVVSCSSCLHTALTQRVIRGTSVL